MRQHLGPVVVGEEVVVLRAEQVHQVAGHLGRALAAEAVVVHRGRRLQCLAQRLAAVAQVVVGAPVGQVVRAAGRRGRRRTPGPRPRPWRPRRSTPPCVVRDQVVGQRAVHPAADHRVHLAVRALLVERVELVAGLLQEAGAERAAEVQQVAQMPGVLQADPVVLVEWLRGTPARTSRTAGRRRPAGWTERQQLAEVGDDPLVVVAAGSRCPPSPASPSWAPAGRASPAASWRTRGCPCPPPAGPAARPGSACRAPAAAAAGPPGRGPGPARPAGARSAAARATASRAARESWPGVMPERYSGTAAVSRPAAVPAARSSVSITAR